MDGWVRAEQTRDVVHSLCRNRSAVGLGRGFQKQMWVLVYNPGDHLKVERQESWLWNLLVKSPQEYFLGENLTLVMKLNQKPEKEMSESGTPSPSVSRCLMNKALCDQKCLGMRWVKHVFFVLLFDHNIFTLLIILVSVMNLQEAYVAYRVSKLIWPGTLCSLKLPLKDKSIESQEVKRSGWHGMAT